MARKVFIKTLVFLSLTLLSLNSLIVVTNNHVNNKDRLAPNPIAVNYKTIIPKNYNQIHSQKNQDISKFVKNNNPETEPLLSTKAEGGGYVWDEPEIFHNLNTLSDLGVAVDNQKNIHAFWTEREGDDWYIFHKIKFYSNESWSEVEKITSAFYSTQGTIDVATNKEGRIYLIWTDTNRDVTLMDYYNSTWSNPVEIGTGFGPKLRIKSDGLPLITYAKYGEYNYIYYYQSEMVNEENWSPNLEFYRQSYYSSNYFYDVAVTVEENKELTNIVSTVHEDPFHDANDYAHFYYSSKSNTSNKFSEETLIVSYAIPAITMKLSDPLLLGGSDSQLHLFANLPREETNELVYQNREGIVWKESKTLSTNLVNNFEITGTIDSWNKIAIVWTDVHYGIGEISSRLLFMSHTDKAGWSNELALNPGENYSRFPSLSLDGEENLHLIWLQQDGENKTLRYRKAWADHDYDGLTNKEEEELYNTDPIDADCDDDGLPDGLEIDLELDPWDPDWDSDGMLDGFEVNHNLDPKDNDAAEDPDGDSLTNLEEFLIGTKPNNADSDGDGLADGEEVAGPGSWEPTNPNDSDTDNDKLNDAFEINELNSNPNAIDTDADGMDDWYEYIWQLNVLIDDSSEDPDGDGLINIYEYQNNTRPDRADHDGDGLNDYEEIVIYGTDPIAFDSDFDGLEDGEEVNKWGTDPTKKDTDNDSLNDYKETQLGTNPVVPDSDADGMIDGYEAQYGLSPLTANDSLVDLDGDGLVNYNESLIWTDPFNPDTDGDFLNDKEEFDLATNPLSEDSDFDGLTDYQEIYVTETNALDPDTDKDGLNDYDEYFHYFSDGQNPDSDGDGLKDGIEVYVYGTSPTLKDSDYDEVIDSIEIEFGSNPLDVDTDNDEMDDYFEWLYELDPNRDDTQEDVDQDGLSNIEEYENFASPRAVDTDQDGIPDYHEIYTYYTTANAPDSDMDGLTDFEEVIIYHTSPLDPDSDDDGIKDGKELTLGTDPTLVDTDQDGINDGKELLDQTNPLDIQDNINTRRRNLVIYVFSGIICFILIYYLAPFIISKLRQSKEEHWIREGLKKRDRKHKKMLEEDTT
ncbi:MAG: hypothetical protein GF308_05060 [Candidatus Heimdallarchaeota archaeon]|nr:hypothetical protein [Candidatus Heimdallarchaeota archaeon]